MEKIGVNLKYLREQARFTQQDLADKLSVSRVLVTGYEQGRIMPPVPVAIKIADLFKVDLDNLIRHDLRKGAKTKHARGGEVLSITVDSNNKENVELVSQKASAGYLNGYADVEYLKDLPKINIPSLPKSNTYRGFEIKGDSMLPVKQGDIIIGQYVDNLTKIKNGKTYIIVSATEGIVYKRVFTFLGKDMLLMVSDNRAYDPYTLHARDVLEVWSFKGRITFDEEDIELPGTKTLDFLATRWFEKI
ncbi:MAG TPA: LexA family transcriptional regulator [Cyclobacteriaceae bacterium]